MDFHLSLYCWLICANKGADIEQLSDAWSISIDDWKNDLQVCVRPQRPLHSWAGRLCHLCTAHAPRMC